jgi:GntR family transcriptional regulator, carbon starvation induced regulator
MLALNLISATEANRPRSQASAAYEAVRSDILTGHHKPGQKLKINDLATELKVSPGAVREALSRLVPEQLVVSRDQRGFIVAPLSIADLEDLTDLRCEIEGIALQRSVYHGDINWEAGVLAAAHRLRRAPKVLNAEWVSTHAAFHHALVSACRSPRLLSLHSQLYEQSERYRGLSYRIDSERNVEEEHHQIVDLALARDADGLVRAMTNHIRQTTALIVEGARCGVGSASI